MKLFFPILLFALPAMAILAMREATSPDPATVKPDAMHKTLHRVEIIGEDGNPEWVEVEIAPASIPEPAGLIWFAVPAAAMLTRRRRN